MESTVHLLDAMTVVERLDDLLDTLRDYADPKTYVGFDWVRTVEHVFEGVDWVIGEVEAINKFAPNSLIVGKPLGYLGRDRIRTLHAALTKVALIASDARAGGDLEDRCGDFRDAADFLGDVLERLSAVCWYREGAACEDLGWAGWHGNTEAVASRLNT